MPNKREQRIRRKARAAIRAVERDLAQSSELRAIAIVAIDYITEIYEGDPREPWGVAKKRDRLTDAVRAYRRRIAAARRAA